MDKFWSTYKVAITAWAGIMIFVMPHGPGFWDISAWQVFFFAVFISGLITITYQQWPHG